jgi:hypothetical protein
MPQEAADMTAIVLPDIDRSTIEELKKRIPDLTEIELNLPSRKEVSRTAKEVSRTADETIDRLLGRKRASVWPWIAAGIGLIAVIGAVAAWFAWFRRPSWESQSEPWTAETYEAEQTTMTAPMEPAAEDMGSTVERPSSTRPVAGQSTAEPVGSAPYPIEEA